MRDDIRKAVVAANGCFTTIGVIGQFACAGCGNIRPAATLAGGVWVAGDSGPLTTHYLVCTACEREANTARRCPHYWNTHDRGCLLADGHAGEHVYPTPESEIKLRGS